MTYTYTLDQNDYLNHQLFFASVTLRIHDKMQKNRIIWTVTFLLLSFCFFAEEKPFLSCYFLIAGIAYGIFYPSYSRRRQKKHFENHVNRTFEDKFDKIGTITIDDQIIHSIEEDYDMKIAISEVKHIYETRDYFYAQLKSDLSFIFPKQKIENIDSLEDELRDIANKQQIRFTEMIDWKWK